MLKEKLENAHLSFCSSLAAGEPVRRPSCRCPKEKVSRAAYITSVALLPEVLAIVPPKLSKHQTTTTSIQNVSTNCKSCDASRQGRRQECRGQRTEQGSEERSRVICMTSFLSRTAHGLTPPQVLLAVMSGAFGLAGFYFGNSRPFCSKHSELN